MRFLYLLILIILAGAVGIFAWQNSDRVVIHFDYPGWKQDPTLPLALLVAIVYLLGMLTGWTVVGILRRSWREVTTPPPPRT